MISFSNVPPNVIASNMFVEGEFRRTSPPGPIPQRVALFGQPNEGVTVELNKPVPLSSAHEAATRYGPGSMLHRMAIALFRGIGNSTVQIDSVALPAGVGSAVGQISFVGYTQAGGVISLYVAGTKVLITIPRDCGDTSLMPTATPIVPVVIAAINAATALPVIASAATDTNTVNLTAKWLGKSGNQIDISLDLNQGDAALEPPGLTIAVVAPTGGAANPNTSTALTALGGTFYTWVVWPYDDDPSLDELEAAGNYRMDPGVKKPFVGVCGSTVARADYVTWLNTRNSPWCTSVNVERSPTHISEIAAATVGVCAVSAQVDPSRPYKTLTIPGVIPGTATPWTYSEANAVEMAGGSWTKLTSSGDVQIGDLLTTYTTSPAGATDESFRYTVGVTNYQAKVYSIDQVFLGPPFDRGKIVDDLAVTGQPYAIRPKTVKAYVIALIDDLWIPQAWSKNRDDIVNGIVVEVDKINPGRINVLIPDIITVGLRIVAVKYQWSFSV